VASEAGIEREDSMKQGLVWYDNDPKKTLDVKMVEAARRYKEKFGAEPTVCYVNPAHLDVKPGSSSKLRVVSAPQVLPNHLWLEID
jgi:hypothetical protein